MASAVIGAVTQLAGYCGPFLLKQIHYMISPGSYIGELDDALKELDAAAKRVQHSIDDANSRGDGIEEGAWMWIKDVKELKETMSKLISRGHPTADCFIGRVKIPDPMKRRRLAKQAVEMKEKAASRCKEEKYLGVSYHIHHPPAGGTLSMESPFVHIKTHTKLINDVWEALEGGEGIVGIYGIKGVGKSKLVRTIALGSSDRYDKVKIFLVSTIPDVHKLRTSIENTLKEAEVNDGRKNARTKVAPSPSAGDASDERQPEDMELTKEVQGKGGKEDEVQAKAGNITQTNDDLPPPGNKRVLLILDDLSVNIDDLSSYLESRKNLKVQFLVTSNDQNLLSSIVCSPILSLNALDNTEARQLLTSLVGLDKADKVGNIKDEQLSKTCAGLPFLIHALAQIIKRSKSSNPVSDALDQLPNNLQSVDTILELSYKQLDNPVKLLFSLCALLGGQTIKVQSLFRYSVGIGLFDKVTTMSAARNKMSEWLKSLIDSSLLLGTDNNHITIQHASRDFAVKYAFQSHYPRVIDGTGFPNVEIFISHGKRSVPLRQRTKKNHNRNPTRHANIVHDSLAPQFAEIFSMGGGRRHVLLFKSVKEAIIFISCSEFGADAPTPSDHMESFFKLEKLEKLKVVHLENLSFTGLFPVILKDLVTLCLHNCHVKNMDGIGNLKSLQVVSFFGSVVVKLPKEVGELKKLRSMDFRGCLTVEQIEPGALEGLSSLEELFLAGNMERAYDKWEVDGAPDQTNASLAELNSMPHLETLDVYIPNPSMLPKYLAFSALERYSICIGDWDSSSSKQTDPLLENYNQAESRILKLHLESSRVLLDGWFQATMKRVEQLHLKGLRDSKKSIHELCVGGGSASFHDLKHLEIQHCPSTHYVVRSTEWFARNAFTSLEFLSLDSLMNLEKIGHGLLSPNSFGKLKKVVARNCENLKSLFSLSSIHGLSQLQRILIYDCRRLQSIIVDERTEDDDEVEENDQVLFPCSFSKSPGITKTEQSKLVGTTKMNQSSSVAAAVQRTDKVVSPEDGKITMHNLLELVIESSPNLTTFFTQVKPKQTEEDDDGAIHNIPPAFLFSGDDKISFPKLKLLTLRNLDKLKEIWQITEAPMDLANLTSLKVYGCTSLLRIFPPKLLEKCLQNLRSLTIEECPLIQEVFDFKPLVNGSATKKKILPQLKNVTLTKLRSLKYIVSNKNPRGLVGFENLSTLDVVGCGKLEYIFTSSMAKAMKKLEHISIAECDNMKAIVSDEAADGEQVGSKIRFPALKVLKIDQCPNIRGFSIKSTKLKVSDEDFSRQLVASKCPKASKMRYFLCYGTEMDPKVGSEAPITFFTKVHLPSLVVLKLSSAGKFTTIWHNEPEPQTEGSFSKLSSIYVSDCKELVVAFPATILDRLEQLRDIEIRECPSLRVLFELQPYNNTNAKRSKHMVFSHLKDVILSNLPKLEHVVEKDTKVLVGFPSLTKIDVSSCDMLIDLMPVATATSLSNLETLTLSSCRKIKEVVGGYSFKENLLDDVVFPLLISLELRNLKSLVHFSSGRYQLDFPSLKKLIVENCIKMKIFSPMPTSERFEFEDALPHHQPLFNERVGLPKLEELLIKNMKLEELWSSETFASSFWLLKHLRVEECHELQNVIPSFMLKRLPNLESLIILHCKKVEHIAENSDGGTITFPTLNYLKLEMMGRLRGFFPESKSVKLPLLNHLVVQACSSVEGIAAVKVCDGTTATATSNCNNIQIKQPLFWFYNEIAFPKLENLEVRRCEKLSTIFYGQVSKDGLSELSKVTVTSCDTLVTMFHSNVLRALTNLETLIIWNCKLLKVIYDFCVDGSPEILFISAAATTMKLRKLDIYNLPNLSDIWRYDPRETLNLEKLSSVEIWTCPKLEYIFRASEAKLLFQLKLLDIYSCDFKEVVREVGGEGEVRKGTEYVPGFVFRQLARLSMAYLENLESFSTGVYTVEWPLLSELHVYRCNNIDTFASTFQLQMLQKPLFLAHKDSFPQLKKLTIRYSSSLRRIWQHGDNFTASPFSKLTELTLYECSNLEATLFPAGTVEIFANLEALNVRECDSLKGIYDVYWPDQIVYNNQNRHVPVKSTTSALKLKELYLRDLQKLEHIWNGEPKGSLNFENLSSVTVKNCQSLRYLFSAREGREVVEAGRAPKLLFSRVTSIKLSSLPELKSLYPWPHVFRWPSLKKMNISNCTSIVKLRDDFQEKLVEGTGAGTETHTPLFWADKSTFCLLKEMTLVWNDKMEQEWCAQFSNSAIFPQLQVLNLKGSDGESFHLGSRFIHKVKIKKLTISKASSCKVLFQRDPVEEQVQAESKAAHFTKLEVKDLSELINIWDENYERVSMFTKLKSLEVTDCPKLITLLPSSVLFSNLVSLVISSCHGLKALMTLPAAKSLTQLSSMKIRECDELVGVIAEKNDGDIIEEVSFRELKYLELFDLKSLTSFCSGKCKLNFPLLQELVVKKCPWIKSFSTSQPLTTPKLKTVQTETASLCVKGGQLNKALKLFFKEQIACQETVDLSNSSVWREQWFATPPISSFNKLKTLIVAGVDREKLPAAVPFDKAKLLGNLESLEVRNCNALPQVFEQRKINKMACFKNLQSITISECNGLKCILTTAMVVNLALLRKLHIANCGELVEIVGRKDDVKHRKEFVIEFLKLETLRLESLPKLARFCQLDTPALKFPSLQRICIKECDKMKTFTSGSGNTDIPQESFFCDKVLLPSLEVLRLINVHGSTTIWHGEFPKESISHLKKVYVRKCPALKYVFLASAANSLQKLNRLEIKECDGLEKMVAMGESANATERFVFPKVTILKLKRLPKLQCFYPTSFHTSVWPLLKELEVSGCPKVTTLAFEYGHTRNVNEVQVDHEIRPLFFIGKDAFPKLKKMTIHHMANMKRIWHVHEVASKSDGVQELQQIVRQAHNDGISTFKQLEYLMLRDLPGLVCFSSTICAFLFSSLKEVAIVDCPLMKFFSDGIVSTPEKFKCTIQLNQQDMNEEEDKDDDNDNDNDNDNDSDSDGDDEDEDEDNDDMEEVQNEKEQQFHDLNAAIKEKSELSAMELKKKKEEENARKDVIDP